MSESRALEVVETPSALVVQQNAGIVSVQPVDVTVAFRQYQQIQQTLDALLPDCIMPIQGKRFRKKAYWRAVATAFNVDLELVREERIEVGNDWGWLVTYRAIAPNGRKADGDGSCMASEKRPPMNTLHNVRAHAHTRAKNRATSDLVGFGEVSAEEMMGGYDREEAPSQRQEVPADARSRGGSRSAAPPPGSGALANEAQRKMIWARSMGKVEALGVSHDLGEKALRAVLADLGVESSKALPASAVDSVVRAIDGWTMATFGEAPPADDVAF